MSSRRSRSGQSSGASRISDAQIADLVSKLQQLIPEIANRPTGSAQVPIYLNSSKDSIYKS